MRKQNVLKKVSLFLALALCIGFAGGALLTKKPVAVAETADAFLFVIGEGDLRILPKRVLDEAQTDRVRACLFPGK